MSGRISLRHNLALTVDALVSMSLHAVWPRESMKATLPPDGGLRPIDVPHILKVEFGGELSHVPSQTKG